jgi:hypothetical protein
MKSRSILFTLVLLAVVAGVAMAADISGKWVYSMPTRDGGTREASMTLKADGSALTGAMAGMRGNEVPIVNGKIDGDKISFDVKMPARGDNPSVAVHYKGVVSGDEIKFTQQREGADQTREFTAKRAK